MKVSRRLVIGGAASSLPVKRSVAGLLRGARSGGNPTVVGPPVPISISFNLLLNPVPDNSPAGTAVATFTVTMSDGSTFTGTTTATPSPEATTSPSTGNGSLVTGIAPPLTDGTFTWSVTATQNSTSVTGNLTVTIATANTTAATIFPAVFRPNTAGDLVGVLRMWLSTGGTTPTTWAITGSNPGGFVVGPTGVIGGEYGLLQGSSTPAGTYTVNLTGTPTNTGLTPRSFTATLSTMPRPFPSISSAQSTVLITSPTLAVDPDPSTIGIMFGSGTISLQCVFQDQIGGAHPIDNSVTLVFTVDDKIVTPLLTGPVTNYFNTTLNTLTAWTGGAAIPDGTHVLGVKVIDCTDTNWVAYQFQAAPRQFIVHNSGYVNGAQTVPVVGASANFRLDPPTVDYINYPGTPPNTTVRAYPTVTVAPSSDSTLRSAAGWYRECTDRLRNISEYYGDPQFYTTPNGGVAVLQYFATDQTSFETAYNGAVRHKNKSGGRNNNMVDPYSVVIANPMGDWTGADIGGRVFRLQHDGTCTTLVGTQRDPSKLPLSYRNDSWTEAQFAAQDLPVGTIPSSGPTSFGDFLGANDLCYDPRDSTHNTIYVAKTNDQCIYRADLSTTPPTCTLYAGTDGSTLNVGVYTDGPALSATFNQPSSIIMDASGNMYVADKYSSAIRKIAPGTGISAGAVTTLCGGTVAPGPVPLATPNTGTVVDHFGVSETIVSITLVSGNTYAVVLDPASTPVVTGVGQEVFFYGNRNMPANAPIPNSLCNGSFLITAFTDAHHFQVSMPPKDGQTIGTVDTTFGQCWDTFVKYSTRQPGSAALPFASAYTPYPMAIRFDHSGNIILGEDRAMNIRLIDLTAGTIKFIGAAATDKDNANGGPFTNPQLTSTGSYGVTPYNGDVWMWLDVDSAGVCGGFVDDIIILWSDGIGSAQTGTRLAHDGSYHGTFGMDFSGLPENVGGGGHYPWIIAVSKTQARILSQGFEGAGVYSWRPFNSGAPFNDPTIDMSNSIGVDTAVWRRGKDTWWYGTCNFDSFYNGAASPYAGLVAFPWGTRPGMRAANGVFGNCLTGGSTFDDLMVLRPTVGALNTFHSGADDGTLVWWIQHGGNGQTVRPELTGNHLRDVVYFIQRTSLTGSRNPNAYPPLPDQTDTTPPVISAVTPTRLSATLTGTTSIQVAFSTDKACICQISAGSPNSNRIPSTYTAIINYNTWSPLESAYASGSRTLTIAVVPVGSPTYYQVVAKDLAGNFGVFTGTVT